MAKTFKTFYLFIYSCKSTSYVSWVWRNTLKYRESVAGQALWRIGNEKDIPIDHPLWV